MPDKLLGPTSHYFYSQRLKLHYVDWGNPDKPLAVLIHGGRDHCRNWDWVALDLRNHFHLVAPDLRGHGDSDWAIGGNYGMVDYVLDVAQLMDAIAREPIILIGHSLGAAISLQYAGTFPERVKRLIAIEGLGPPPAMVKPLVAHLRMKQWVSDMQALARRKSREYKTIEEALARMREENPHLSVEQARHLTVHGVRRNEDGTYSWKFDNYTRASSPYLFNLADAMEIWRQITSPCLLVAGDESWATEWEKDRRYEAFRSAERVTIKGAGHWVHHDQLGEFLKAARRFLGL
ncbi:MAG TPA: alpha/beta hydrolase [Candidatus Binataceae bacterium]|nr:alpha/beta hydrolase [Candidatus Binataceae bacterium]